MFLGEINNDLVAAWFAESRELLAMSIFGAGDHDFALVDSFESLDAFESATGRDYVNRTVICLFRGERLPLRGLVDDRFIEEALALVPDQTSCLALQLNSVRPGLLSGNWLVNHTEIITELNAERGELVAFGQLEDCDADDQRSQEVRGWVAWRNRFSNGR